MEEKEIKGLDNCSVRLDDKVYNSTDFVAFLAQPSGDVSIFYNTDALTLGMALKMLARQFVECLEQCTEEERNQVEQILGDAFIAERLGGNGQD